MTCSECSRFNCDCDEMMLDIYSDEIVPGEQYLVNAHDEAIHVKNAVKYLIEDGSHQLKTR
ncbi:MAG: hypothetical protein ABS942_10970 [Solibacillus sp.]